MIDSANTQKPEVFLPQRAARLSYRVVGVGKRIRFIPAALRWQQSSLFFSGGQIRQT